MNGLVGRYPEPEWWIVGLVAEADVEVLLVCACGSWLLLNLSNLYTALRSTPKVG